MDSVEDVVDIDHAAAGHLPEAAAGQPNHGAGHAQQAAHIGQVPEPRDGRLRAERVAIRDTVRRLGTTKASNVRLPQALVENTWTYRHPRASAS